MTHLRSIEHGSDFGSTEGKTHVTRVGSCNRVHSKTTSLVSGGRKCSLRVGVDSSAHLQRHVLANAKTGGRTEGIDAGSGNGRSCKSKR